jgi:hypothetical protein
MPIEIERKLKAEALKKFGSTTSSQARRYIWGTMNMIMKKNPYHKGDK